MNILWYYCIYRDEKATDILGFRSFSLLFFSWIITIRQCNIYIEYKWFIMDE